MSVPTPPCVLRSKTRRWRANSRALSLRAAYEPSNEARTPPFVVAKILDLPGGFK